MTLKSIGIIPARYASTRFPGKPLADIDGKPMIQRVYEQAQKCLDTVYVATDDNRIADAVTSFGGQYIMTSVDHQSGTDRIAEAITTLAKEKNLKFDVVVNIQGDEPFIQPQQIQNIVDCFQSESVDIATLIKPIDSIETLTNPNSPKVVISTDFKALYFSRNPIPYIRGIEQENWLEKQTFYKHIGIYGYRSEKLLEITQLPQSKLELAESLEQLRWLENGYTIKTAETDFEGLAVDTPEDLEILRKSLKPRT